MTTRSKLLGATLLALAFCSAAAGDDKHDKTMEKNAEAAGDVLTALAKAYNARDAKAIAELFTPTGHVAGEEAGRLAITTLLSLVLTTPDWILSAENRPYAAEIMRRASERFDTVNRTLAAEAEVNPRLQGFGTTMTMAANVGRTLIIAHIGDTRAYLFRRGELFQLTRDHTLAHQMCEAGIMTPAQAATHRLRHTLTKNLGADTGDQPDVENFTLQTGDCVLLCSDGLSEMVSDDQIAAELAHEAASQAKCETLVDLALAAGGKDNVTVVLSQYRFTDAGSS